MKINNLVSLMRPNYFIFIGYFKKLNDLVSLMRPNYFIFIGYLKTGGGGLERTPPPHNLPSGSVNVL